jgi:hypothetical protein
MQCSCCENYTVVDGRDLVMVAPERPTFALTPSKEDGEVMVGVPCREMRVTLTPDQMRALAASLLGAAGIATIVGEG